MKLSNKYLQRTTNSFLIDKISEICTTLNTKIMTFVDVGANKGKFTSDLIKALKKKKIYGNAYLFEPNILLTDKLKKITHHSKWNIELFIGIALGSRKERKKLIIYNDHTVSSLHSVSKKVKEISKNFEEQKRVEVQVEKLDNFQKKLSHINLLKIDTQGNDLETLKGCKKFLKKRNVDIILVEYMSGKSYNNYFKASELFKLMEKYNYKLHSILTTNYTKRNYLYYCDFCFFSPSIWKKLKYI